MKKNKFWMIAVIVCLVLVLGTGCGWLIFRDRTEGVEDLGISTGVQNESLAYDADNQILYVGTHDNLLVAFQDGEELWRTEASGAYSDIVLDVESDRLYAANEDNHVYVYQASDGSPVLDINVQRKVVGLDVNGDRTKLAVITNTGSSKSNLFFYSMEGEELSNTQYSISLRGVMYCSDGETLFLGTKRGEVQHITEETEVLNTLSTDYEIIQMIRNGDTYWAVNQRGYYYEFNEDLECLRSGRINNTVDAVVSSIGVDKNGEYVLVGSEEGYLFVMDGQEKQIYMVDEEVEITDFVAVEDGIYFTGHGDFVRNIYAENLAHIDFYQNLVTALQYSFIVALVLLIICVTQMLPKARRATRRLLKKIWIHRMAYIMLIPTFVLVFLFCYRGIFRALIRAFTDWSRVNNTVALMDFVGLENFKTMFTEGYFLTGMRNLLILMATGLLKTLTVPLIVAWLVYNLRGDKRKYVHRFLFVLPIVVPGVISAMIWEKIYDPSIGLINNILGALNLESLQRVWLGDAGTAIWAVVFMGFPFIGAMAFLVYYGGFINISNDIIESAMIDSATKWDIFWKVQLPMIRPQISILITLQIIGTMQDFNSIFILTGGGPGTATYVPALELYLNVAQFGRYGYASALGVVLLIFTLAVTMLGNRLSREKE